MAGQQPGQQQYGQPQPGPYGPQPGMQAPGQPAARKHGRRAVIWSAAAIVVLVAAALVIKALGDRASGSGGICTSNSCITGDLQRTLTGLTDKADQVVTKVVCQPSTVKNDGGGIYSATCTVTHSDGTVNSGTGTVETKQGNITFSVTP